MTGNWRNAVSVDQERWKRAWGRTMSDSASHCRAPLRSAAQALSDDIEHALEGRREVEALLEPGGNT